MAAKENTSTTTKPDGRVFAKELLQTLHRLNSKRDAPVASRKATKAAIRAAVEFPEHELDRFTDVISDWLICEVLGCGIIFEDYFAEDAKGLVTAEGTA